MVWAYPASWISTPFFSIRVVALVFSLSLLVSLQKISSSGTSVQIRCDIYNFISYVLYSHCYSPSECLPFAIIKMRFGNCTTKAKGVSLSFSPFKLICIPHLAQGFRHTKSGAGQPPRTASSISCRLASSSCPCPALPCLWPVSRQ